jgi:molybdopterin-guanine dinucleotide biosynthesis protein MobB
MHTIISVVGKSSSGKTTLLERLISKLRQRGYKVAIIKHSHHANDLDTASKDTWRFTKAGSEISAINSLDNLAIYRRIDHYFDPQEISQYILWEYDLILTEGFKSSDYPKIEVHRQEQGQELLTEPEKLLAVVTDEPLAVDVPQYSRDDIEGIAELIEKTITNQRKETSVDLIVNGVNVPLDASLQDLLSRTLVAMIPNTQNNGAVTSLHLSLRRQV